MIKVSIIISTIILALLVNIGTINAKVLSSVRNQGKRLSQKVIFLFSEPLPNPPLKQSSGGNMLLNIKLLHPFPYCLRGPSVKK